MAKYIYLSQKDRENKKTLRKALNRHTVTPNKILPAIVDHRDKFPPCYDQGDLGSCTANAIAGNLQYLGFKNPSRLFIYYNELLVEDTDGEKISDNGADAADGCINLEKIGVCTETTWPYDITKFNQKPTTDAYTEALQHKVHSYSVVERTETYIEDLKTLLATEHVILTGIAVYSSLESNSVARTGLVPLPKPNEKSIGGHEVLTVGYDDNKQAFIVRNSWGVNWGLEGYFYLPYTYFQNPNLVDETLVIIDSSSC